MSVWDRKRVLDLEPMVPGQRAKVVYLPVVHDVDRVVFVGHGLTACPGEIDDRQPPVTEGDLGASPHAPASGPRCTIVSVIVSRRIPVGSGGEEAERRIRRSRTWIGYGS